MNRDFVNLPLNPLRAFSIASRHKTFTAAAEHMGITQVAISRQIALLERYLGLQLFERGARSVKLTEAGRSFGQEIAPLFDSLDSATQRLLLRERDRTINLRIYPTLTHHWLLPMLAGFREGFPEFEVRLDTQVEALDFRGTHLDAAVQLGSGMWKDAKSRLLFPEVLDAVCSPEYAKRIVAADGSLVGESLTFLHSKYRRRAWADWSKLAGISLPPGREQEYESSLLTYSAAINGMGLAIGQVDILKNDLESGSLVRPFQAAKESGSGIYVIWPTTKSPSLQTRRFVDWLLASCGQKPEFFTKPPIAS